MIVVCSGEDWAIVFHSEIEVKKEEEMVSPYFISIGKSASPLSTMQSTSIRPF